MQVGDKQTWITDNNRINIYLHIALSHSRFGKEDFSKMVKCIGTYCLSIHCNDISVNSVGEAKSLMATESSIATFDPPVVSISTERPNSSGDLLPEVVTSDTEAEREVP